MDRQLCLRKVGARCRFQTGLDALSGVDLLGGCFHLDGYWDHRRRVGLVEYEAKVQESSAGRRLDDEMTRL